MAIAYDTSVDGGNALAASLTYSHTCTGTNRIIFVAAGTINGNTLTATYNGVSMTSIESETAGTITTYFFYLKNPASGANNVVVTISAGSAGNSISAVSASYNGVRGNPTLDSTPSGTFANPGTTLSVVLTTVADNCWAISGGCAAAAGVTSGNATTTIRKNSSSTFGMWIADTNGVVHPAGSVTQKINCTSEKVTMSVASFSPPIITTSTFADTQGSMDGLSSTYRRYLTFADTISGGTDTFSYKTNRFRGSVAKSSATFANVSKSSNIVTSTSKSSSSWSNTQKTQ